MSNAAKWAVIRNEAPVMPWEGEGSLGDKSIFRRLASQSGTAFALKVWNDADALICNAPPPEEAEAVKQYVHDFTEELAAENDEFYAALFWRVMRSVRLQAWGMREELRAQP
jgi:hypothetical protein